MRIQTGQGVTLTEGCEYECAVTVNEAGGNKVDVPFSPLAIPGPAWSKRHASVSIKAFSDDEVHVRFEGDTMSFRANFSELNVPGRYENASGEALPEEISLQEKKKAFYVRIIKMGRERRREVRVS